MIEQQTRGEQLAALRKIKLDTFKHKGRKVSGAIQKATLRAIDDHRDKLEPDDIEFLSERHRGAKEVVRYSEISESSLKRMADDGTLEVRRTDSGHRRYRTLSVVRHLIERQSAANKGKG